MTGERLHVREVGTGTPLLLLHGWSCHSGFFQPQFKGLRDMAHIIAPDLPGHGETGARLPLSIEAAADAVAEVLADRDLTEVNVCSWSMGAHVAYALIQRHGTDRIRQVVGIDMTPKILNSGDWHLGADGGFDQARNEALLNALERDWSHLAPRIACRIFAAETEPDANLLDFAREEIGKADPSLLKPMWASLTSQDFRELLTDFPVPLHMAFGARSALYGRALHQWHKDNVPGVCIHTFENSGHAPHLEEHSRFNGFLRWLMTPAVARTSAG
jgi:pimeloyl-[acyl-carrier protein] methyl ester esterase